MGFLMKRNERSIGGQGLVEFALVLPIFLLLLFGMVEFGRAWMTKNILTGAAREAVRRAAVQVDFAASDNVAKQRATEVLNSAGIGVPPAVVTVNSYDSPEPPLEVTGNHSFPIIVGGFFGWTGPGGTIMLTTTTSMRRERY
jgi:Flp pilus assembly protein TadG